MSLVITKTSIFSPEWFKPHRVFLYVGWNKANGVSQAWWQWEIINIVYTVTDSHAALGSSHNRQCCQSWLVWAGWMTHGLTSYLCPFFLTHSCLLLDLNNGLEPCYLSIYSTLVLLWFFLFFFVWHSHFEHLVIK